MSEHLSSGVHPQSMWCTGPRQTYPSNQSIHVCPHSLMGVGLAAGTFLHVGISPLLWEQTSNSGNYFPSVGSSSQHGSLFCGASQAFLKQNIPTKQGPAPNLTPFSRLGHSSLLTGDTFHPVLFSNQSVVFCQARLISRATPS